MWVLCLCGLFCFGAASAENEQGLIGVLQSDKPAGDKAAACRSLKIVGTAQSVPALAALLVGRSSGSSGDPEGRPTADKGLAHWARWALESMPCPEAGTALREALAKTAGVTKAGLCDSIGERRDREAVPTLAELAKNADPQIAASAATALGKIGGAEAAAALKAAQQKAPEQASLAIFDALLLCADQFRTGGDKRAAAALYYDMSKADCPQNVRVAACRGLHLASESPGIGLPQALAGDDRAARSAALQLAGEIKDERLVPITCLAILVHELPPVTQVALVEALRQRGNPVAVGEIVQVLDSKEAKVRIAALEAVGALGDASIAPRLAEAASKATGAEQDAARESLNLLRDPKVRDALLEYLAKAQPPVQAEIVRALGFRKETQAVPALLKMAGGADEAARLVAIKSLAMLADSNAAGDLTQLLLQAKSDAERDALEQALGAACVRGEKPEASAARILGAMKDASVPARVALLRVAGKIGGAEATQALRAGLLDKEPAIQDAALRSLADFGGPDAAPDLLKLAQESQSVPQRVLALRGYCRILAQAAERPLEERWTMCKLAIAAAQRPEEKKLGIAELAKIPHPEALKMAQALCDDEAVRGEAEVACVQLAVALSGTIPAEAKAALQRIAASSKNDGVRAEARKALDAVDQYSGYITTWLAAGPYRQEGKQCKELFDIPFAPEQAGAGDIKWQPAPHPADAALFWQTDLLPICGGDQCVVYMRTRVWSPKEQKVRLDIGSDDGNKVWVNGKVIHANNVERAIRAGDDKAEAALKDGWNDFLLKITQNVMGCGACVRIRSLDGAVVEGLRFETGGAK